jgi:hypothetical protein
MKGAIVPFPMSKQATKRSTPSFQSGIYLVPAVTPVVVLDFTTPPTATLEMVALGA